MMIHLPRVESQVISFGGSFLGPKRRDGVKGEHFCEILISFYDTPPESESRVINFGGNFLGPNT